MPGLLATVALSLLATDALAAQQPLYHQAVEGYEQLRYLGGGGPYVNRKSLGINRNPPEGATVDQVILLMRHGERYPQASLGAAIEKTLASIKKVNPQTGTLKFINDWTYFVPNEGAYEQETTSGPYGGLRNAYLRGNEYRERYDHLVDLDKTTPFWSSDYQRVIDTARHFGEGFWGYNYSTAGALNIISEQPSWGANSLTPDCPVNGNSSAIKTPCGDLSLDKNFPLAKVAAERLNNEYKGLNLSTSDIYNLFTAGAYEYNARSWSPWFDVFSRDEWLGYSNYQGLQFYYGYGAGNKGQLAVGAVYANASLSLLNEGPEKAGKLFLNFAHDDNIFPIVSALGLAPTPDKVPCNGSIGFQAGYQITDYVPQGAHLVIERLNNTKKTALWDTGIYVRVVLNEQVLPFDSCQNGPGFSCKLEDYNKLLQSILLNYNQVCQNPSSRPQSLDFWWHYNTTSEWNYQKGPVPYQATTVIYPDSED